MADLKLPIILRHFLQSKVEPRLQRPFNERGRFLSFFQSASDN